MALKRIRVGTSGIPASTPERSTANGVRQVRELGLDAMEIEFVRQVYLKEAEAREVKKAAVDNDVELSVHAPYYVNLASLKPDIQKASVKRVVHSLRIGELAGARIAAVHAGFYMGRSPEETFRIMKNAIKEVFHHYKGPVLLGIETMGKQKSFGNIAEVIRMMNEVDRVSATVDFSHIHAYTNGGLKKEKDFENIIEKFRREAKLRHFHCHLSCIEYKDGNEKRHLPLASKSPDMHLLANVLKRRKERFTVINESPFVEHDALLFSKWVKA